MASDYTVGDLVAEFLAQCGVTTPSASPRCTTSRCWMSEAAEASQFFDYYPNDINTIASTIIRRCPLLIASNQPTVHPYLALNAPKNWVASRFGRCANGREAERRHAPKRQAGGDAV